MALGLLRIYRDRLRGAAVSELIWVAAGQAMALGGTIASVSLLTKRLTPSGYGELGLGMTLAGVVFMLVYNPLSSALVRFYSVFKDDARLPAFLRLYRFLFWGASLVVLLGAGGTAIFLSFRRYSPWSALAAATGVFAAANGMYYLYCGIQTARRRRRALAIHLGLEAWLRTGGAVMCLKLFGGGGASAMLGYGLAHALLAVSQRYFALRSSQLNGLWRAASSARLFRTDWIQTSRYTSPFIATALATAVSLYGDRWIMQATLGPRDLGIYTALNQFAAAPGSLIAGS